MKGKRVLSAMAVLLSIALWFILIGLPWGPPLPAGLVASLPLQGRYHILGAIGGDINQPWLCSQFTEELPVSCEGARLAVTGLSRGTLQQLLESPLPLATVVGDVSGGRVHVISVVSPEGRTIDG